MDYHSGAILMSNKELIEVLLVVSLIVYLGVLVNTFIII